MKSEINFAWFKRDLRFTDHEPLWDVQNSEPENASMKNKTKIKIHA